MELWKVLQTLMKVTINTGIPIQVELFERE